MAYAQEHNPDARPPLRKSYRLDPCVPVTTPQAARAQSELPQLHPSALKYSSPLLLLPRFVVVVVVVLLQHFVVGVVVVVVVVV